MAASPPKVLARVSPAANTWTDLYTPSTGASGAVTIWVTNAAGTAEPAIKLAVVDAAGNTPAPADHLHNGGMIRQLGAIALVNPQTLRCWSSIAGIAFIVSGYEE